MGVGDDREWTICLGCGQNVTTGMCVCAGDAEFVFVRVVPVSVADGLRGEVERLQTALVTALALVDEQPDGYATPVVDQDCPDCEPNGSMEQDDPGWPDCPTCGRPDRVPVFGEQIDA